MDFPCKGSQWEKRAAGWLWCVLLVTGLDVRNIFANYNRFCCFSAENSAEENLSISFLCKGREQSRSHRVTLGAWAASHWDYWGDWEQPGQAGGMCRSPKLRLPDLSLRLALEIQGTFWGWQNVFALILQPAGDDGCDRVVLRMDTTQSVPFANTSISSAGKWGGSFVRYFAYL